MTLQSLCPRFPSLAMPNSARKVQNPKKVCKKMYGNFKLISLYRDQSIYAICNCCMHCLGFLMYSALLKKVSIIYCDKKKKHILIRRDRIFYISNVLFVILFGRWSGNRTLNYICRHQTRQKALSCQNRRI